MTPWEKFQQDWKGKRVLIMGLGLQGRGVGDAKVFAEAGAVVTVTDLKTEDQLQSSLDTLKKFDITCVLGKHREEDFKNTDMVMRNPDVPKDSPYLKIASDVGIPIKMDSSLFATYCQCPIIGITGTRGKTTTTMMIYEILKDSVKRKTQNVNRKILLGGNIPGKATLELLKEVSQVPEVPRVSQVVVFELSSWELQGWHDEKISPHVGVFTNFYEDHLNRYSSMDEYFEDKTAIGKYQREGDYLVLNFGDKWVRRVKRENGDRRNIIFFSANDLPNDFQLTIPGEHNRANAAAALAATQIIGGRRDDALVTLSAFGGVPYRLETIATVDGVEYINDTTSTTPIAGVTALRAMRKPIILIAGGSSKKLDLKPFVDEIIKKAKHVIFLKGEGTDEMLLSIASLDLSTRRRLLAQDDAHVFDNLRQAVEKARALAQVGDAILLSPGCASFSMFKNEFDRGEQFNHIVHTWQNENKRQ